MKYSILMPYFDRIPQLTKTLESFRTHYAGRTDYEIVFVLDQKSAHELPQLKALAERFSEIPMKMEIAETNTYNPAPHFNQATRMATGEYFVVTNPEGLHKSNVLGQFDAIFATRPEAYIVAACEAQKADGSFDMWYQHREHRNKCYHFCSVIKADLYRKIGGFDEEYAKGIAYDDDDFLAAIRHAGIEVLPVDEIMTIHQFHGRPLERTAERKRLVELNRALYTRKWGKELPL